MAERLSPVDEAVRIEVIDPERSFAVQAPAGSGKTELLTQRFLGLLARVREPQQVLAITFTRKATREMADRVLERLRSAAAGEFPDEAHLQRAHELAVQVLERDRIENWGLLEDPGQLQIHTIDGLCARLAARGPLQAFAASGLSVAEYPEPLYREAARQALDDAARAANDDPARKALETLLIRERGNANRIQDLLAEMLPRRDQWLGGILGEERRREALIGRRQAVEIEALEEACGRDTLLAAGRGILTLADAAETIDPEDEFPAAWHRIEQGGDANDRVLAYWLLLRRLGTQSGKPFKSRSLGKKFYAGSQPGRDEVLSGLRETVDGWHEQPQALAAFERFWKSPPLDLVGGDESLVEALKALLALAVGWLQVQFSEQATCDFQHVAAQALQALGDVNVPGEALLIEDQRLQHVLIDEFQDTSQLQFDLVSQLVEGFEPGDGRTLFLVGDPMQSIYRFRKADVSLFEEVLRHGRIGPVALESRELSVNFRSTQTVVDDVNATCEPLFAHESHAIPGHVDYKPASAQAGPGGAVRTELFIAGDRASGADLEAEWIAEQIGALQRPEEGTETIGVLARKRVLLEPIARALAERGIEFEAVDVESLASRSMVLDLLTLTRALAHPGDRVAWLALLTAPWCALQPASLLTIAGSENDADLVGRCLDSARLAELGLTDDEARSRVERFGQVMRWVMDQGANESLARRVEVAWILLGGPRLARRSEDLEDAERYLALLQALEREQPTDFLGQLTQRCERLYAGSQTAAVKLMTIHKAKGLEFDAVFLPGLGAGARNSDRPLFWQRDIRTLDGSRGSLVAPLKPGGSDDPSLYDYLGMLEREDGRNESKRLLYVAMTRARRNLFLTAVGELTTKGVLKRSAGSLMTLMQPRFEARVGEAHFAAEDVTEGGGEPGIEAVPVLELAHANCAIDVSFQGDPQQELVSWVLERPPRERLAFGDALHHWLELLHDHWEDDWPTRGFDDHRPALRSSLLKAGAPAERLPELESELAGLLERLLRRDDVVAMLSAKGAARSVAEAVYLVPDGNRVRRQIIDLLIRRESGDWEVVDYKTGRDSDQTRAHWRSQLNRYRDIVDTAESGTVVERRIFQAVEGRFIDPETEDGVSG